MTRPKIKDDIEGNYIQIRLEEADANCLAKIAAFRSKDWTADELSSAIMGLGKPGNVPWRQELLYMLSVCEGEPLSSICKAIGVTSQQLMTLRRRDEEVKGAVKDYLGAYFEGEAMAPEKCIRPQIVVAALTNHAEGWGKTEDSVLTQDRMQAIIRAIIDAVKLHVKDGEIQRKIGADIKAALDRNVEGPQIP